MKRIICGTLLVLLIIINISALAEEEIKFSNIPWLSDDEITLKMLEESGLYRAGDHNVNLMNEECFYLITDYAGNIVPSATRDNPFCYSTSLKGHAKGKIAGYPVHNIILTYAYNGEYQLIYIKVELLNTSYSELKEKLTKKYGISQEQETIEGLTSIWKGDDNSCVALFSYDDGESFELVYGRLDAEEILLNCQMKPDPDDISGI